MEKESQIYEGGWGHLSVRICDREMSCHLGHVMETNDCVICTRDAEVRNSSIQNKTHLCPVLL